MDLQDEERWRDAVKALERDLGRRATADDLVSKGLWLNGRAVAPPREPKAWMWLVYAYAAMIWISAIAYVIWIFIQDS